MLALTPVRRRRCPQSLVGTKTIDGLEARILVSHLPAEHKRTTESTG